MRLPSLRLSGPWLLGASLVLAGAIVGAIYGALAPKDYRATAQVLVTPLPASDTTFTGMDLFRETGGRHTAAASAAALLDSPEIASAVIGQLGLKESNDHLLSRTSIHQVGSSNVVNVTVTDSNAGRGSQIANAFVSVFVSQRTAGFISQLTGAIQRDESALASTSGAEHAELARRLAILRSFQSQPDPTVKQAVQAAPPTSASGMGALSVAAIGAGAGLIAGLLVLLAFAIREEMKRRAAYAGPHYERRTFEQMAERLEGRVHERLDALAAEEERLADREREMEQRERRIDTRMEELKVMQESGLGGSDALMRQLADREDAIDAKDQEIASRHRELAAGLAELSRAREAADQRLDALIAEEERIAGLEQALAQREQEVADVLAKVRHAQEVPTADELREAELTRREEAVRKKERELAVLQEEGKLGEQELTALLARETALSEREAEIVRQRQALSAREHELAARESALASAPAPVPVAMPELPPLVETITLPEAPPPAPPPVSTGQGRWNVRDLEALLERHGDEFPARVEEWRSYLYFLRDHADSSGALPSQFDWLVEDTFSELLARSA